MRTLVMAAFMAVGVFGLYGCQSGDNPNSPAMQALENPPNSCGPGGSQDTEDCDRGR